MSEVTFIGDQVSYRLKPDGCSVVITARTERWKETLLVVWVLAWTICGAYFLYELSLPHPRETKMALVIMLFFWFYFELKIGRAMLWRLWGYEQVLFSKGRFSIKRSIKGYGKRHDYFTDNINHFHKVDMPANSFLSFMENSFWVLGGERIYFEHLSKKVALGRQLDEETTVKLISFLNKQLTKWKE